MNEGKNDIPMRLSIVDYHILDRANIINDLVSNSTEIHLVCMLSVHLILCTCSVFQINYTLKLQ